MNGSAHLVTAQQHTRFDSVGKRIPVATRQQTGQVAGFQRAEVKCGGTIEPFGLQAPRTRGASKPGER